MLNVVRFTEPFHLEQGGILPQLDIAYTVEGKPNTTHDNVVLICHALTGDANPQEWWSGLVGPGRLIDPNTHMIVCANNLGSCYGTTGPTSINPESNLPYAEAFPEISIRDMVRAYQKLTDHLGIQKVSLALGGSMGGQMVLEWAIDKPRFFEQIIVMATNAQHSPWGIAFNETQRMAVEASLALDKKHPEAKRKGLEAARAIAMLSYRSYDGYEHTQSETDHSKTDDYKASSYQRYQGQKFAKRFDLFSYLRLSKAMDSHHVGRNRGSVEKALNQIAAKTLVIGIDTDLLFPISEQVTIANHIPHARLEMVRSKYGHDGFLVEFDTIAQIARRFLQERAFKAPGKQYQLSVRAVQVYESMTHRALPGTERF